MTFNPRNDEECGWLHEVALKKKEKFLEKWKRWSPKVFAAYRQQQSLLGGASSHHLPQHQPQRVSSSSTTSWGNCSSASSSGSRVSASSLPCADGEAGSPVTVSSSLTDLEHPQVGPLSGSLTPPKGYEALSDFSKPPADGGGGLAGSMYDLPMDDMTSSGSSGGLTVAPQLHASREQMADQKKNLNGEREDGEQQTGQEKKVLSSVDEKAGGEKNELAQNVTYR